MALVNFCYYVANFFFGIFFILVCIAGLIAGAIGLVLLFTPFPYFPTHRQFIVRFWTFAVTALFLQDDDGQRKEWVKVKEELRQLASWQTARKVIPEYTKED
jgi:hypothetical protein